MRRPQALFVVALAASVTALAAAPAGAADMVASTATGLRDGQIITLNVSGFAPDPGQLSLLQCRPTARTVSDCDAATVDMLVTNGDGTGSAPFAVRQSAGMCDATHPCAVFAAENPLKFDNADPQSHFAMAPIAFGPAAAGSAPLPAPAAADPSVVLPPLEPSGSSLPPLPFPGPVPAPTGPTPTVPVAAPGGAPNAEEPPMVPEVPMGVLLPLGAAATMALAARSYRRRNSETAGRALTNL